MGESAREKLERLRRERESSVEMLPVAATRKTSSEQSPYVTPPNPVDPDLVPDIEPYQPTEEDQEIDRALDGLDIIEAYRRWSGKMDPKIGNKRESIMISCPRLDHPDKNPSAWINLDKQTWYCARCDDGGDTFTLVARTKGYEGDSYQHGKNFPDLRREMAEDLGFVIRTTPGGTSYTMKVESEPEAPHSTLVTADTKSHTTDTQPASNEDSTDSETLAPVVALHAYDEEDDAIIIPKIEWMSIAPPDTFLYDWMNVMRHDDLPEEFYFWHGLMALGLACGRDALLADRQPVFGNLFVCLYGPSGQGKTRSTSQLSRLLRLALPYTKSDPDDTGTYLIPTPGSPEALIDSFSRPVPDDSDPKIIDHWGKVRGLVRFDELSTLIGRASRTGNPLKPILQQFYDSDPYITTSSRGHGDVEAHEAFCSVVSTTQPRAIRQVLLETDVDSGFANRWVYAMGHSKQPIPFGGPDLNIDTPVEHLRKIKSWAAFKREIGLTDDAADRWVQFYGESLRPLHSSDDAMTSRVPLLMKKLILLLAVNSMERTASVSTVESAIELFPYVMATYKFLSGDLGSSVRQDFDRAVIYAIRSYTDRTKKSPSSREIYMNLGKQHRDSEMLSRSLKVLTEIGLITEQVVKPTRGRPTSRYVVNEWT